MACQFFVLWGKWVGRLQILLNKKIQNAYCAKDVFFNVHMKIFPQCMGIKNAIYTFLFDPVTTQTNCISKSSHVWQTFCDTLCVKFFTIFHPNIVFLYIYLPGLTFFAGVRNLLHKFYLYLIMYFFFCWKNIPIHQSWNTFNSCPLSSQTNPLNRSPSILVIVVTFHDCWCCK